MKHDFLGATAAVAIGFTLLFLFVFVVAIKLFDFPKSDKRCLEMVA